MKWALKRRSVLDELDDPLPPEITGPILCRITDRPPDQFSQEIIELVEDGLKEKDPKENKNPKKKRKVDGDLLTGWKSTLSLSFLASVQPDF